VISSIDRCSPVTTVTLNRPEVNNALDRDLSEQLNHAVREIRDDADCRVVVFQGAGDTFCAGDDIAEFNDWEAAISGRQIRLYQETAQIIEDLTKIIIAKVDGVAVGGGLELTLVCDFVVATDRSRWGMPEIDWEITPGWGDQPAEPLRGQAQGQGMEPDRRALRRRHRGALQPDQPGYQPRAARRRGPGADRGDERARRRKLSEAFWQD